MPTKPADDFYPRPPRGGRQLLHRWRPHNQYHFYPRPPRGGRPKNAAELADHAEISIHALREEGDAPTLPAAGVLQNFYPRPPRGGRHDAVVEWVDGGRFLSTPSARRATYRVIGSNHIIIMISIHALREEGDSKNREKTLCVCLIIHLSAQIAKRCLQTKPQNHTVTCANGWYSGAKRPGKPCVLPVRTGRTSKNQHAILCKLRVQSNVLDLGLVVVAQLVEPQTVQGRVDQGGQLCFETAYCEAFSRHSNTEFCTRCP